MYVAQLDLRVGEGKTAAGKSVCGQEQQVEVWCERRYNVQEAQLLLERREMVKTTNRKIPDLRQDAKWKPLLHISNLTLYKRQVNVFF